MRYNAHEKAINNLKFTIYSWEMGLGEIQYYCVYIIRSILSKNLYIGQTNNFHRRFLEHKIGKHPATRNRGPWEVLFIIPCQSRKAAIALERKFKNMKRPDRLLKYAQNLV